MIRIVHPAIVGPVRQVQTTAITRPSISPMLSQRSSSARGEGTVSSGRPQFWAARAQPPHRPVLRGGEAPRTPALHTRRRRRIRACVRPFSARRPRSRSTQRRFGSSHSKSTGLVYPQMYLRASSPRRANVSLVMNSAGEDGPRIKCGVTRGAGGGRPLSAGAGAAILRDGRPAPRDDLLILREPHPSRASG